MVKMLRRADRREQKMNEGQKLSSQLARARPVCKRKPLNYYVEWILNGLQQLDHSKMLEDKEPIKTLRPKLLKRARILQGNCSFFQGDKLSRVFVNRLNRFLLLEVTMNQEIPSFRKE